jgi:hypothetical protein
MDVPDWVFPSDFAYLDSSVSIGGTQAVKVIMIAVTRAAIPSASFLFIRNLLCFYNDFEMIAKFAAKAGGAQKPARMRPVHKRTVNRDDTSN